MIDKDKLGNWRVFLQALKSGNSVRTITDLSTTKAPFIGLDDRLTLNKRFAVVNIPHTLASPFLDYFKIKTPLPTQTSQLPKPFLGTILEVIETGNVREALVAAPLSMLNNTSFRNYLSKYDKSSVKMTPVIYLYITTIAGHPLFNYLDKGNTFYTKMYLLDNGIIYTRIGKAKTALQYFEIMRFDVDLSKYIETYLTTPYRKKLKEITNVFVGVAPGNVVYKNVGIESSINDIYDRDILFEVDYSTEDDLINMPKKEIIEFSQYKENVDLSRKLLLQLSGTQETSEVKLPSGLIIKKNRAEYAKQELYSSIVSPEDLLFNTKTYFPMFAVNNWSDFYLYKPILEVNKIEELNWDMYLESFIKYNWVKTPDNGTVNMKIGTVDVKLEYRKTLFYVNDKRINKDEVPDVLMKALCATTQQDFDDTVTIISKTSLEMHRFISEGLIFRVNLSSMTKELSKYLEGYADYSDIEVSFRIVRIKNLNYIELTNDKLIQIKDSRRLMSLRNQLVSFHTVGQLFGSGTKVLSEEIDLDVTADAGEILKKARERYVAAFKKSILLMNEAIEELGAEKLTKWEGMSGVKITGSSGASYFIQVEDLDNPMDKEPSCTVYRYPSKQHICIVDKSGGGHMAGVDRVVARLYALKNDSVLAEHITTIQEYVRQSSQN